MDDSEIVITKKLSGGGSSVRIRIGGSARSPTQQVWQGWRSRGRGLGEGKHNRVHRCGWAMKGRVGECI